ncbi:CDP-alcohol phosphatidyltransferase family protein [Methylocystis sp. WRRC1]|uniref:CDP-alcohol phosphatidyltransferase family protein n=1 Tax=Methylocystis sp. WRRC1 TaxID=1732014 RepID=UPI001D138617|nr:CDP-alcohol phosphatidyltransferase family protein [Methylocystis sp. WRRC1]
MANVRINDSFLAIAERAALAALVRRLPSFVTPDHLTGIGLLGAVLTAAGFVACWWSNWFLVAVVFGLFLNWFGDSLDGTLARYRKIERPHYGYFVDHSADLIAQTLIVVGLGASPFFTVASSLLVLSLYLLMSSYTYLRVVTESIHRLSYGGMGATEFRILVACWALFAGWFGPGITTGRIMSFVALDVVIGALSACTFLIFVFIVRNDLARMQRDELSAEDKKKASAKAPTRDENAHFEMAKQDLAEPAPQ